MSSPRGRLDEPPTTVVGRVDAARRAERELYLLQRDHPAFCFCVLCNAWSATWNALRTLERPGHDMAFRPFPPTETAPPRLCPTHGIACPDGPLFPKKDDQR